MSKINKLGKSTFVIAILSFLLVAVLAFGGTYAYFSATTGEATTGKLTMGTLEITADTVKDSFTSVSTNKIIQPGQEITANNFSVTVKSDIAYFVRVHFVVELTGVDETHADGCLDKDLTSFEALGIDATKLTEWTQAKSEGADTGYYYKGFAAQSAATADAGVKQEFPVKLKVNPLIGQKHCKAYMGAEVTVTVEMEVIQADYIAADGTITSVDTLHTAWNTALAYTGA